MSEPEILADIADLRRSAAALEDAASEVALAGAQALAHAHAGALAITAPFSPGTAAHATAELVGSGAAIAKLEAGILASSALLIVRADLFIAADAAYLGVRALAAAATLLNTARFVIAEIGAIVLHSGGVAAATTVVGLLTGRISPAESALVFGRTFVSSAVDDGSALLDQFPQQIDAIQGSVNALTHPLNDELPDSSAEAILILTAIAERTGAMSDGRVVGQRDARDTLSGDASDPADIVRDIGSLSAQASDDGATHVAIRSIVEHGERRWLVEIHGTKSFAFGGSNPSDMLTNSLALSGRSQLEDAVLRAMDDAGIPPGERVMLAGHSQGGIVAAALASEPATRRRFNVTEVFTVASPVDHFRYPPEVQVTSVQHTGDLVPRLDAVSSHHTPNHHTYTVDRPAGSDIGERHGTDGYVHTVEGLHGAPIDRIGAFLGGPGATQDITTYTMTRE